MGVSLGALLGALDEELVDDNGKVDATIVGANIGGLLMMGTNVGGRTSAIVGVSVGKGVESDKGTAVGGLLGSSVGGMTGANVGGIIGAGVGVFVGAGVDFCVGVDVGSGIGSSVGSSVAEQLNK